MSSLFGYKGKAKQLLKTVDAEVGDFLEILGDDYAFQGVLMPRTEYGGRDYLVIKLKTGYNIGVRVKQDSHLKVLFKSKSRPTFKREKIPEGRTDLPRVDVISTGGTIASRVDYRTGGVEPALNADDLYSIFPELSDRAHIHAKILLSEYSENITGTHWKQMANSVKKAVAKGANGVVICHGTDTMGYTSAALSFALHDLPIPVVLVGSQRSSDRPSSDASSNLLAAVSIASEAPFAEVVITMHEETSDEHVAIHRGTRVRKCHTSTRTAFKTINSSPIAYYDILSNKLNIVGNIIRKREKRNLLVNAEFEENVALIKFYPTMNPEYLEHLLDRHVRGIILEGTGLGHVSSRLYAPLERAANESVFIGMTSQCIWGAVNMNVYYTGRDLLQRGVVPLGDMLAETALVKLMWVLGQSKDLDEIKKTMLTNIVGELSSRRLLE